MILSNSATPGIPKFVGIEACIHDGWLLLRNLRHLDKLFCYYLLLFERPRIVEQGSGTVFTNLRTDILKRHRVKLPPLPEQRAIAHVLGTLDDKIELNRRMDTTLEEMARALFKSWFVDFEPVRAKMEGRWRRGESLPGLPAHLHHLFPDRLVDSALGEIPEGWEVKQIDELADVRSGKRPKVRLSAPAVGAEVPVWGGNGPMAFTAEPLFDQPMLLTGRVGTLGSVFRISGPCWPSDNTLIVMPQHEYPLAFLFFHLQRIDLEALNRGSTQPLLTQTDLKSHKLAVPCATILEHFGAHAAALYSRIDEGEQENQILVALRDSLLPRLVSGEVRVGDTSNYG